MTAQIHIAIIGGGVIGCAVARELSGPYDGVFLFEKTPGITQGENQSSRNSGVIHSGIYYDQETRPQKVALCVEGNRLLYDFCDSYKVPALKTGKLIVATSADEEDVLDSYLDRAGQNHVPGVTRISGSKVRGLEPNVRARSALAVPTAGVVEPISLVYRLHTLASRGGVQFMTDTEVTGLEADGDFIRMAIRYRDGHTDHVSAKAVINAAGVDADMLASILNTDSPYELDPVRGESYKFYGHKRPELKVNGMNIYPTPESVHTPHGHHFTVGVHLTPTFEDLSYPPVLGSTVTVGPKLVSVKDRGDLSSPPLSAGIFAEKVRSFFPGVREDDLIWHQVGLQARLKGYPDFIIAEDSAQPNFINLLGIDSPGLTSCLAIARRIGEMVERLGL
ncbi:MAG: FAD-dependent oxidoreductase [Deltaproteobacteria bacterium]|nr:FAD-dependent oxidoreductase [Deltaproteobacteria bacterium]